MKTWDVMRAVVGDPSKEYRGIVEYDENYEYSRLELNCKVIEGTIKTRIEYYSQSGSYISSKNFDGIPLEIDMLSRVEWEEVKMLVTWQEAFEAWMNGKGFIIEYLGETYRQPCYNKLGCLRIDDKIHYGFEKWMYEIGKWYIE